MDEETKKRIIERFQKCDSRTKNELSFLIERVQDEGLPRIFETNEYLFSPNTRYTINDALMANASADSVLRILSLKEIICASEKIGEHMEECKGIAGSGDGHSFDDAPATVLVYDYAPKYSNEERMSAKKELEIFCKNQNPKLKKLSSLVLKQIKKQYRIKI